MNHHSVTKEIWNKTAPIGIIGMGYVGLPLALTFASRGFTVIGFDVDKEKVNQLKAGRSYINHISENVLSQHITTGQFVPCTDFAKLAGTAAIIVCVPTPLTGNREPDLSFVESTAKEIALHLQVGQLVVLESTTYPGCCDNVVKPLLENSGLTSGTDFYLAYSPEREDPGNPEFATASIPKVVGADGFEALELARALYNEIVVETIPVSSIGVAEAVKLMENIFRSVNIALVNELKTIYSKLGIDIWEVIEAAKTKPFGYMPFYPGPGLGGHCIPIDPYYLTWRAKQVGEETKFIQLAGEINTAMPEKVVDAMEEALKNKLGKSLRGAHILLAGVAYKKNVDDTRETPAFVLIESLEERGATVDYYDPYVPVIPRTRDHGHLAGRKSIEWALEHVGNYDATLICTDHDAVDYEELVRASNLIIDTRNAVGEINGFQHRVIKA